jgi:recombinational DNA repair ATPase RecF
MKLSFIDMCGFRGYSKPVRIDFSESFTVIDGRNGAGKSTVFDAIEFALTGSISKYLDAKADRESVDDYLWWTGVGEQPRERYVRVGFVANDEQHVVERTPSTEGIVDLGDLRAALFDEKFAPKAAMSQLCAASIIRDEHIARLSLDLKEGDRFTLLRDVIGAVDSDEWIKRSGDLVSVAASRLREAAGDMEQAKAGLANIVRQVDVAQSAIPAASVVNQARERLQQALGLEASFDHLGDRTRQGIAEIAAKLETTRALMARLPEMETLRGRLPELEKAVETAERSFAEADEQLQNATLLVDGAPVSSKYSERARQVENLVALGQMLGLRDGHCPLCETGLSREEFQKGIEATLAIARALDAQAVEQSEKERARDQAKLQLDAMQVIRNRARQELDVARAKVQEFDLKLQSNGSGATSQDLAKDIERLEGERASLTSNLRLFDTRILDQTFARVSADQGAARDRLGRAEARLGRARLAETRAKAIHDAVRRSAAETLEQRLERVLPLMSELYRRLRPHPVWEDIEYSVRGDVKRFLKLQVGEEINPQFVFSSGQRRATGLAFLLSINLSIAWSRWRSILLDDPVQHVDDFRTVHLAEVLAHLCESGRQIVCAVEDAALADLMCRRLPSTELVPGLRVTLSNDQDGAVSVSRRETIAPLSRRCLVGTEQVKAG